MKNKFQANSENIEANIKGLGTCLIQIMSDKMIEDAYVYKLWTDEENDKFKKELGDGMK